MKILLRKSLALILCAVLLFSLSACSLSNLKDSAPKTAAGEAFLAFDPARIKSVRISYTDTLTETTTVNLSGSENIEAFFKTLDDAVGGKESVAWSSRTDSVDGGKGYVFTIKNFENEVTELSFVLAPTKGYLRVTADGAESLYFDVGEKALESLAGFYPA